MNKQKKIGKYILVQQLGKGQFGIVFKGLDSEDNETPYAIKTINKSALNSSKLLKRLFESELEVMRLIQHPNLLHLYDMVESSSNYYLILQLCEDGDLEKYIKKKRRLSEEEAIYFLKQIMSGFVELHKQKIMHRDFKLANIFLHKGQVVIGDFGFAKAGVEVTSTRLGTPYNMAPELLNSTGKTPYTNKADLWSIGIVFFQMLHGRLPFNAMTLHDLKNEVKVYCGERLRIDPTLNLSKETIDLLHRLLQYEPYKRINWREFFNHPVFEQFSSHVPQYNMTNSINKSKIKHINENDKNPIETSKSVNQQFYKNRHEINVETNSNLYNLPSPINYNEDRSSDISFKRSMLSENQRQDSTNPFDKINDFFSHQRNKHLMCFQSSKRGRDLSKIPDCGNRISVILTASLILCKKGLLFLKHTKSLIDNEINVMNFEKYDQFIKSKYSKKIIEAFQEDEKTFLQYFDHLNNIIDSSRGVNFDSDILFKIRNKYADINLIDTLSERVATNLFQYYLREKGRIRPEPSSKLLIFIVYLHLCIDMEKHFPLKISGGLFDWKNFSRTLQRKTDEELEVFLEKYKGMDSQMGKLIFKSLDEGGGFLNKIKRIFC